MTRQLELDFSERIERPHHRTTTLTTTMLLFNRYKTLSEGGSMSIEFTNDYVSSAKGGSSVVHHMLRRRALLDRQIRGGYRKVKIRCTPDETVECEMVSLSEFDGDDACSATVVVRKPVLNG